MKFEYDNIKINSNLEKHKIDFETAKQLWLDNRLLEIPAKTTEEERFIIIAKLNDKCWTGVITYRGNKIRIISVRRSRNNEEELYESY